MRNMHLLCREEGRPSEVGEDREGEVAIEERNDSFREIVLCHPVPESRIKVK
jgi:hypothetical protein